MSKQLERLTDDEMRNCQPETNDDGFGALSTERGRLPLKAMDVAARIDGLIATNTTVSRAEVRGQRHADEAGGLSGRPLRARSTAVIRTLAKALDGALPIIGVGGIMTGADAREKIDAGATLVQVYTGLIYRGPDLVAECGRALA